MGIQLTITALLSQRILLVPYSIHHVPTYHDWMKSPALQQLTASEPLSLEQEYEMQKSWRDDHDKLTFIACLAAKDGQVVSGKGGKAVVKGGEKPGCVDGEDRMIGDINLFVTEAEVEDDDDEDEDEEEDEDEDEEEITGCAGEVEIMVARTDMHGNGIGTAILLTFLWYVLTHLDDVVGEYSTAHPGKTKVMRYLRVKIDAGNLRSLRLFEKVGFRRTSEKPNFFNELELRFHIPSQRSEAAIAKRLKIEQPEMALYQLV